MSSVGGGHVPEERLEVLGVLLVEPTNFAQPHLATGLAFPLLEVRSEYGWLHRDAGGGADVCSGDLAKDMGRHCAVGLEMGLDVARGGGDPRRQHNRVDERDPGGRGAREEMGAQHGAAADVVPNQRRLLQLPGLGELGEHLAVERKRDVLLLVALRLAVAQQIKGVNCEALGERQDHVAPQHRTARGAMHQDDRRTAARHVPRDLTAGGSAVGTLTRCRSVPPAMVSLPNGYLDGGALAEHRCRFVIEERQHRQLARALLLLFRCANAAAAADRFPNAMRRRKLAAPGASAEIRCWREQQVCCAPTSESCLVMIAY